MAGPVGGPPGSGPGASSGVQEFLDSVGLGDFECEELEGLPGLHRRDVILIQLLELVRIMLQRLEETVIVQSQESLLSTRVQRKYTSLIAQIDLRKVSELGDDPDNDELEELKSDNEVIQKRLEDLRNSRTQERDRGKELTDALKSTNDNIQQQSQLGAAILQQLAELIRAIFR